MTGSTVDDPRLGGGLLSPQQAVEWLGDAGGGVVERKVMPVEDADHAVAFDDFHQAVPEDFVRSFCRSGAVSAAVGMFTGGVDSRLTQTRIFVSGLHSAPGKLRRPVHLPLEMCPALHQFGPALEFAEFSSEAKARAAQ
ncbi:hypothetical protein [Streptomyces sp. ISL-100]|uniref:hypothetical protein n=1 Tax=Streptomyces sp. ISL-100 TaxID=2819173 RepID=UPI001BE7F55B|nr:hypothetical protein [Streptomyces sp. ISL-100]MBT2395422.1 hypothetical protein [Streptomyces sp. ISL-100]